MSKKPPPTLEERGFRRLGRLIGIRKQRQTASGKPGFGESTRGNWASQAGWAQIQEAPIRARSLLYVVFVVVLSLILWAGFAELDEVTRGQGRVIPSSQTQLVQSLDGGTVSEIRVDEGDVVSRGDLLVKIDSTRAMSQLRENQVQRRALVAEIARLEALTGEHPLEFPTEIREQAPEVVAEERKLHDSSRSELDKQMAIHRYRLEQRDQDLEEAKSAETQHTRALELIRRELEVTRPLLNSGAVSEVDLLRLERDEANSQGQLERARTVITRSRSAIEEAKQQVEETRLNALNRWRSELSEANASMNALTEAQVGLTARVTDTQIRAPMGGTVQRLFVTTTGGVVGPGREILEITPNEESLLIEARIQPKDIALLRPGLPATIKFSAYDFTQYGGLDATLTHISSDTITDDNDNTFYLVRLKTEQPGFSDDQLIRPGMVAEVDILTGEKTVLEYLLKPVTRAFSRSMAER